MGDNNFDFVPATLLPNAGFMVFMVSVWYAAAFMVFETVLFLTDLVKDRLSLITESIDLGQICLFLFKLSI